MLMIRADFRSALISQIMTICVLLICILDRTMM